MKRRDFLEQTGVMTGAWTATGCERLHDVSWLPCYHVRTVDWMVIAAHQRKAALPFPTLENTPTTSVNAFAAAGVFPTSFSLRGEIYEQSAINTP